MDFLNYDVKLPCVAISGLFLASELQYTIRDFYQYTCVKPLELTGPW